jgi:hypothetical protein
MCVCVVGGGLRDTSQDGLHLCAVIVWDGSLIMCTTVRMYCKHGAGLVWFCGLSWGIACMAPSQLHEASRARAKPPVCTSYPKRFGKTGSTWPCWHRPSVGLPDGT